jgi:hypothetical protein
MSRLKAKRKLHDHGQTGNWRFKGLMLAALDPDVTPTDVAKAWPNPDKSSDYRFLGMHNDRDPEAEQNRKWVAERGEDKHRLLSDYAQDPGTNAPKHLSDDPTKELGDGTLGSHVDKAVPRMLFAASEFEEVDTLFREFLGETVREGARQAQVARDAATITQVDSRKGDLPVAQDDITAPPVAPGGQIRDDGEKYDTVPFNAEKYGVGARVTDELVETANIDKIEREIEHTGRAVENAMNRVWLRELVDNAASDIDASNSDSRGYSALNDAWTEVDKNDFTPDAYASHPEFRGVLFGDTALRYANRAGSDEVVRDRTFDPLLDLDMHAATSGTTYDDSDSTQWPAGNNTWAYDSADEIGAVVYDRDYIEITLKNDIEVKDYDDPIRDLQGVNARAEFDCVYTQQRAGCTISY